MPIFEEVVKMIDTAVLNLKERHLTDAEVHVLRGVWEGLTYKQMSKDEDATSPYATNYLKQDVGPKLWELLGELLGGEVVGKPNARSAIVRLVQKYLNSSEEKDKHPELQNQELRINIQRLNGMLTQISKEIFRAESAIKDARVSRLLKSYSDVLEEQFKAVLKDISTLPEGRVEINGQPRIQLVIKLLEGLLNQPQREVETIYVINYGDTHRWWDMAPAQDFMFLNKRLTDEGINISRIFVLPDKEAKEKMNEVIKLHEHIVDTRWVINSHPVVQQSLLVCGDLFTSYVDTSKYGDEKDGYISVNKSDIEGNLAKFKLVETVYAKQFGKEL